MEPITVVASFTPKQGGADAFLRMITPMIEATRAEPGNERYDLYRDDDGDFHLIERYTDAGALAAHRETPHYRTYRALAGDVLDGAVRVTLLKAIDVAP
jgi:quinol monooxygenase YgiN